MSLVVDSVSKKFARFPALNGASFSAPQGAFVSLLGPSGSGKTTLLRILGGLEVADSGTVRFADLNWLGMPARTRNAGFVFQQYALFKHMTVADNIAFGLKVRPRDKRPAKDEINKRVTDLLQLVQLPGLEGRYPSQLSGGQRQRVALARALAIEPRVLLLDEPFGALDAKVRKDLRRWLRELHQRIGTTTIFVTHDQEEALELADRVVIMNQGRIEQAGSVNEVYEYPASPFVFEFLGNTNILPATAEGRALHIAGADRALQTSQIHPAGPLAVYVRPADLRVAEEGGHGIGVTVSAVQRTGALVRAEARVDEGGATLSVELPHLHHDTALFVPGARLRLRLQLFSVYPDGATARAPATGGDALGVAASRERSRDYGIGA